MLVFENTREAVEANSKILESTGYDLGKLLQAHSDTTLGYGSEFRTVTQLKPLIGRHPHFNELAAVLEFGMSYIFERDLDPVTKSDELQKLLARGNHKLAKERGAQVKN